MRMSVSQKFAPLLLLGLVGCAPGIGDLVYGSVYRSESVVHRQPVYGTASHQNPQVRVWFQGQRDLFSSGDRVQLYFRASDDAHVAVIHVDTDGSLEFLYPFSPWDNNYVRGGRAYSLPPVGRLSAWSVRGNPGIGYVYAIASREPLDFRAFQHPYASRWDFASVGRVVRGDPFLAFDRLTDLLLLDARSAYSVDVLNYYVGGRHSYPSYACYDRYRAPGYRYLGDFYTRCDHLTMLLRQHPYYYDTRRYRGDRRVYWRELEGGAPERGPRHGYKEPVRAAEEASRAAPPVRQAAEPAQPVTRPPAPSRERPLPEAAPPAAQPERRPAPPPSRPRLERREPERERPSPPPVRPTPERSPDPDDGSRAEPTVRPSSSRPS